MDEKKSDHQYSLDIVSGTMERTNERLVKVIIALVVAWALTIGAFIWYLNQYDFSGETTEIAQDGAGLNIIGTRNGAYVYGTESNSHGEVPHE